MRLILKIALLFLSLTILFSSPLSLIFAEEDGQVELVKTAVNPGSFYYPYKRLVEKIKERLVFSQEQKMSLYTSLLKIRLSELNFVASNKVLSEIQKSSERFSFQAGVLAQEVINQNKINEKIELVKKFDKYTKFLASLRDQYPANSSFWMLIQHDINTLNILSERLK